MGDKSEKRKALEKEATMAKLAKEKIQNLKISFVV